MKKRSYFALSVILGLAILAGCGKNAGYSEASMRKDFADEEFYMMDSAMDMAIPEPATVNYTSSRGSASTASFNKSGSGAKTTSQASGEQTGIVSRKVIKSAYLEVQTLKFDEFIENLKKEIEAHEGYIENASVSGNNIYNTSSRNANFTVRVPEDKIDSMMNTIGELGTVTSESYNEEDITLTYVDVESRIKTLTTEQETLLGLLEQAKGLEDIIRLEERLSEVNYQLETYKSRLRTYDNKISYSTLNISVREVQRVTTTVIEEEPKTLGQRIAVGFKDNMKDLGETIGNFIVWFLSYIVNIILVCGIVTVGIVLATRSGRKYAKKKSLERSETDDNNETKMGNNK